MKSIIFCNYKKFSKLLISRLCFAFLIITSFNCSCQTFERYNGTKLPIGMNISSTSYYCPEIPFTDVMKTASNFLYYNSSGNLIYDSRSTAAYDADFSLDSNGWPTLLPMTVTNVGTVASYLFYINNTYTAGTYKIFFDGSGTLSKEGGVTVGSDGQYYITLDGTGENRWIKIIASESGDHIRNMRILPSGYNSTDTYPTFLSSYLNGLKPFHCIRFMTAMGICDPLAHQIYWADRIPKTYFTQSDRKGWAYEYICELANTLNVDIWISVPHLASDDYITQMATFFKSNLNSNLKVYLECSNEMWNWIFYQSHWIADNGTYTSDYQSGAGGAYTAVDSYVTADLAAIGPAGTNFPEKDAYMIARAFRLWSAVWTGSDSDRLVRVATGQTAWMDNTRRILTYLFQTDTNKTGCDAFAVGGYFGITEAIHNKWLAAGSDLTYDDIYTDALGELNGEILGWWNKTADYVNQFGIPYLVYEGGQDINPYQQQVWAYNQKLYNFQIDYRMYKLYTRNFEIATASNINCQLFMAFSYITTRESIYGSWGHLENESQIGSGSSDYILTAPKYQFLLDANAAK